MSASQPCARSSRSVSAENWNWRSNCEEPRTNLKVVVEEREDRYHVASVPALRGCWSQGKTREEGLKNIREAVELFLNEVVR
ncbi:MAG: type II toxin-antitoxin system HicB family antitoxin [Acidobacteria bacterium]|nr:type II toxin-antitoxin system HicB family antitoxin [Acidobacteriota bacterium]